LLICPAVTTERLLFSAADQFICIETKRTTGDIAEFPRLALFLMTSLFVDFSRLVTDTIPALV
jgi:hypothetical protein